MPPRPRPRLSVRARDALQLVAAAIDVGLVDEARIEADRALGLSGWGPHQRGFTFGTRGIFYSRLIPRAWAYYARDGIIEHLLVHPDAALFVADLRTLELLFAAAEREGGGLLRLDQIMATVVLHTLTPPDDASAVAA